ncbi:DUF2927 domain-containing protein [Yoonia sp. 208BN28-4]|uniref:DUF2927 domain-containing protein n=1 Tax=Yoonia sp. 208BN28-4 TaxID=3126505 RepID=UPI0030AF99F0
MNRLAAFALCFVTSCAPTPQNMVDGQTVATRAAGFQGEIPSLRMFTDTSVARPSRPNREIAQDFLDLAFRMESGRNIPALTRFDGPIKVRATGNYGPTMITDLEILLDRMRREAGLDISLTTADDAQITVEAVPRATLQRAVPRAACFVVPRINSWADFTIARRTSQVDWTTLTTRDRATIFVPADVAPQEIRDCLHEELAQALGPLNDLYRLPDSVFNDDNIHTVLTGFDMLILRLYYSPALRNGMTRRQVADRLPALLARMNPAGQRETPDPAPDTSRDWINAMEEALANGASPFARRAAAERAIALGRAFGWTGAREGFAHYAYGRLQVGNNSEVALASFNAAERAYRRSPETQIHAAHIAVQQAAFALAAGDGETVLRLTESATDVARRHQNAALMSTLMMFQAEALDLMGNTAEAEAIRLDSLGWARYGFGSEASVQARLNEIAALRPF